MKSKQHKRWRPASLSRYIWIAIAIFLIALAAACFSGIALRLVRFSDGQASVVAEMVSGIIAAIAAGLVLYELKIAEKERVHQSDIDEASFILQINQTFIQDPNMAEVESQLERNAFYDLKSPIITEENKQKFVNYLVYLEGLAPVIMSGILKFEHIDNLMAYRFFLAVNNPELQEKELIPFASYYHGCYKIYSQWAEYRKEHRLGIPLKHSPLDKTNVYPLTQMDLSNKNLEMRQLSNADNLTIAQLRDIAELIYDTDRYIYPALFHCTPDPQEAAKTVISGLLAKNTDAMFCKENLFVAQIDDIVVGTILWHQGDLRWDADAFIDQARALDVTLDRDTVYTVKREYFDEQYQKEVEEATPISIINVSLNPFLHGRGYGGDLLKGFMAEHKDQAMELLVLADNKDALGLYNHYGFQLDEILPGFSLEEKKPVCYKMIFPPKI